MVRAPVEKHPCRLCSLTRILSGVLCVACTSSINALTDAPADPVDRAIVMAIKCRTTNGKHDALTKYVKANDECFDELKETIKHDTKVGKELRRIIARKERKLIELREQLAQANASRSEALRWPSIVASQRRIDQAKRVIGKDRHFAEVSKLRKMMARGIVRHSLPEFTRVALRAVDKSETLQGTYRRLTGMFTDGVEICMGPNTSTLKLGTLLAQLTQFIHCAHDGLRLSCCNVSRRNNRTYLWLSISPDTRDVDERFSVRLLRLLNQVRRFAETLLLMDEDDLRDILVSKVDITRDHHGSFISTSMTKVAPLMLSALQGLMALPESPLRTWTRNHIPEDRVASVSRDGVGLDTCAKFKVCTDLGTKVLTIKYYDKIMDLVCRDGFYCVSSKWSAIVGCKRKLSTQ